MFDSLGDRMKFHEKNLFPEKLTPLLPTFARLDGKNFHSFCSGLTKPYDERLVECMKQLTLYLVKETKARIGYTQSDEITLSWLSEEYTSEIFFSGKTQKMISVLSSMATLKFNKLKDKLIPEKKDIDALFDCRVWTVPNIVEGANVFVWREQDATRNSVQMAARSQFSHKQCENKSCPELQEMLFSERKINWNDYPSFFKKGIYIQNVKIKPPEEGDFRSIKVIDLPKITTIENRAEVLYYNAQPRIKEVEC